MGLTGSYTLAVANTGRIVLNDVTVTYELPEGLSYRSSSPAGTVTGSKITWNLGTLNIGEAKGIVAIILGGVKSGVSDNTAKVTTREGVSATTTLDIVVQSTPGAAMSPAVTNTPEPPPSPSPSPSTSPVPLKVVPVIPAPLEAQNVVSGFWLIPIVLGAIGTAVLIYLIPGRRKQIGLSWEWVPSALSASAINILAQNAGRWTLYAQHQMRVAELASAIAREMNLSKKLVDLLLTVGTSHDSSSVTLTYPVAQTALEYQVSLNGSGYPQKLAGDDIILEARILALADTVETMSSPRPYRPAMDLAKVMEEIKLTGSNLFDSDVFKAFERLVDQSKFKFQTLYD